MKHRLKHWLNRYKYTVMVIPDSKKSVSQVKVHLGFIISVMILLLSFNILFYQNTIKIKNNSQKIDLQNQELHLALLEKDDYIQSLESIKEQKQDEIVQLHLAIESSASFLREQIEEMEKTQNYVAQLVTLFNDETNSNLTVPVSRSYNRTAILSESHDLDKTDDYDLIQGLESFTVSDEITILFETQQKEYETLIEELETRLSYLERRPDLMPTTGNMTSGFGYRTDPFTGRSSMHNGIDIVNSRGTSIWAAGSGIVTFSGYNGSYGNVIIVDHGHGYESVYAHCQTLLVKQGDQVEKGQKIATIGTTGRVTAPHLHFEIRLNGTPINPYRILNTK